MPTSIRKSTREKGQFLARMRLEQMGYQVQPSDERGISFYVLTGYGKEPVKVKTIRYGSWQFAADRLMDITISEDGVQTVRGRKQSADANMLCILVYLEEEAFFVLRLGQLYDVVCARYEEWLAEHGGRRPRVPESMHCSATPEDLEAYRENWHLFEAVTKEGIAVVEPSSVVATVRHVAQKFCLEFVREPYLCYTEHGLHALLFARLFNALWDEERFVEWDGLKACRVQKEYPTAHDLGKSKRQHWDLSVLKKPAKSEPVEGQLPYDCLRLAAALEVGLNEPEAHLREDIRRLYYKEANIDHGLVLHLYRLSKPGSKISGRDWSSSSPRIVPVEPARAVLMEEHEKATDGNRDVEVLYAVAGETGPHEAGVWLIRAEGTTRLG